MPYFFMFRMNDELMILNSNQVALVKVSEKATEVWTDEGRDYQDVKNLKLLSAQDIASGFDRVNKRDEKVEEGKDDNATGDPVEQKDT